MITVLLASHNGASRLPRTLSAFERLEEPAGGWQLVVVDSASTDGTCGVVSRYRSRLPVRCVRHSRRGKNAALNIGLGHIEGDLVVLTDDDVVPAPDWLVQLKAAADRQPDYAVFGGAILPLWPRAPDPWITRVVPLGAAYSITDPKQAEGLLGWRFIWGPNMLVRASIFANGARFDESIGPDGTKTYRMGSESSFTERLAEQGFRFWHAPEARVQHVVRPNQFDRAWLLGRAFRHGRCLADNQLAKAEAPRWAGVPRWVVRRGLTALGGAALALLRFDSDAAFRRAWDLHITAGLGYELRKHWRSRRRILLVGDRAGALTLLMHLCEI